MVLVRSSLCLRLKRPEQGNWWSDGGCQDLRFAHFLQQEEVICLMFEIPAIFPNSLSVSFNFQFNQFSEKVSRYAQKVSFHGNVCLIDLCNDFEGRKVQR